MPGFGRVSSLIKFSNLPLSLLHPEAFCGIIVLSVPSSRPAPKLNAVCQSGHNEPDAETNDCFGAVFSRFWRYHQEKNFVVLTFPKAFFEGWCCGKYTQRYRSGHNGADSKSVWEQSHEGSNPSRCAKKSVCKRICAVCRLFFFPISNIFQSVRGSGTVFAELLFGSAQRPRAMISADVSP